jgi:hypothetical protein
LVLVVISVQLQRGHLVDGRLAVAGGHHATSFSRSGLVDQLLFEGFTPEQAEYGASTTGL